MMTRVGEQRGRMAYRGERERGDPQRYHHDWLLVVIGAGEGSGSVLVITKN